MNVCVCVYAGLSANPMKLETRAEAAGGVSHSETVGWVGLGGSSSLLVAMLC